MRHTIGKSRDQIEMYSLEDMVETDSPVRQIDKVIDEIDTSYFAKAQTKQTGRRPFNPKDMLKLYTYGMDNGVHSSRKLERECKRNVEVMWLMNGLQPDDKTICNFRRENAENITRFFKEYCRKLFQDGYIDGKIVAIDGTKIRANNSKRNNFSASKIDRHIEYIDNKIAEYLQEIENNDKIAELEERKAKYQTFKQSIKDGKVSEVSTTDPDSRLMKQGNNGVDVSYNVQAAVDSKNKLITGMGVTNEPNDQGQLYKEAKVVKDNLGLSKMTVLADKGYYKTDDFKDCHVDGITTVVAAPEERESKDGIILTKTDFKYDNEKDCYYCPVGKVLSFSSEDAKGFRRYECRKGCKSCERKNDCTKGIRRVITRHKYSGYAEQNDKTFQENYELYKKRQLLSEHPFGTVKRTMGIRQFLTRGLINVTAETALILFAYNLKRLRNICKNDNKKDGGNSQFVHPFASFIVFCFLFRGQNILGRNAPVDTEFIAFLRSLTGAFVKK